MMVSNSTIMRWYCFGAATMASWCSCPGGARPDLLADVTSVEVEVIVTLLTDWFCAWFGSVG